GEVFPLAVAEGEMPDDRPPPVQAGVLEHDEAPGLPASRQLHPQRSGRGQQRDDGLDYGLRLRQELPLRQAVMIVAVLHALVEGRVEEGEVGTAGRQGRKDRQAVAGEDDVGVHAGQGSAFRRTAQEEMQTSLAGAPGLYVSRWRVGLTSLAGAPGLFP